MEKLTRDYPRCIESIHSIPIWYNKMLGTKFCSQLSKAGFNYLRDIFHVEQYKLDATQKISKALKKIKAKIVPSLLDTLNKYKDKPSVIYPLQAIRLKDKDSILKNINTHELYDHFIANKVRMPKGLLHWCLELELSDKQIVTALTFARKCSISVFDRVFQYKLVTNILPTNEYLYRYKVKDTEYCDKCKNESDTIVHRLYDCEIISLKIVKILDCLKLQCNEMYRVSMVEFLFGKTGDAYLALNHALLELKKLLFYSTKETLELPHFPELYFSRIRTLIIKEKIIALKNNKYDEFSSKWNDFVSIYDFRGPDREL